MVWVPVVHAYNPSYSGGRDQEDLVQGQPEQQNQDPISKISNTKWTHRVAKNDRVPV
jgi:hypothetical protein